MSKKPPTEPKPRWRKLASDRWGVKLGPLVAVVIDYSDSEQARRARRPCWIWRVGSGSINQPWAFKSIIAASGARDVRKLPRSRDAAQREALDAALGYAAAITKAVQALVLP